MRQLRRLGRLPDLPDRYLPAVQGKRRRPIRQEFYARGMLALGPYATLGLYVAAIWIFIISGAFLCVAVGWLGAIWHRHSGRKCPDCDYMSDPVDVLTHHTLEHWNDHERE